MSGTPADTADAAAVVLAEVRGSTGLLTLNRPKALNALSLEMVRGMHAQLRAWVDDPAVAAVVVRGAGEKAFCAGGDIRWLCDSYRAGDGEYMRFFEEEYALDLYTAQYPKPYIALMDGYVMGGGMGISQHAAVRLVTERTRMAMPEVGIGYFPDVGGSYFLSRLPGRLGWYLALTGTQIRAADALYTGLADVCLPAAKLPALVDALAALDWAQVGTLPGAARSAVAAVVAELHPEPAEPPPLAALRPAIERIFALPTVAAILDALGREADPAFSDWAAETQSLMLKRSPLSMGVTHELLARGAGLSLAECLQLEYALDAQWFQRGDMLEGVRAAIVDKDQQPRWQPATVAEVDAALVASFFPPAA